MAALVLFASCAKPPKAEMDAAEAAVARAEANPDVVAYASDELQKAKKALDDMHGEAAAKRYDKAKSLAAEASSDAAAAIAAAPAGKERAKAKASELIASVRQSLPKAEKLLASAAKVKKASFDFAAKSADLQGAKTAIADAEVLFGKEDYAGSIDKASAAQKVIADLQSEIGAAVQSATRKK
jgi:hypothetical protein